ncbi:MAG: protease modulator HflK, partial [Tepidimonas sp.]|nr:protease modulator HflK [Tepidimonas sp.]
QVQAAFDDVLKAGQERERAKNEAEAYANDGVPRARGAAARLLQEAEGYKARIVEQAKGDAQRFALVQAEYAKAPQVMRERMYLETMQQIYANVTKVLVDTRAQSSLLYLPLDKIMQQVSAGEGGASAPAAPSSTGAGAPAASSTGREARSRDDARSREREGR